MCMFIQLSKQIGSFITSEKFKKKQGKERAISLLKICIKTHLNCQAMGWLLILGLD